MKPVAFFAATDLVVTGTDPEMADYDNPRGELFGSACYVYAEDATGARVRMHVSTQYRDADALAVGERVAKALAARLAAGKLPVAFAAWDEARPAYGSAAYDPAEEVALERREAEEEAWR